MQTVYVDRNDSIIDRICQSVNYIGRKVKIRVTESVTLLGTYWDGGSKSSYTAINLSDGSSRNMPQFNPPQFGGPSEPPTVNLFDNLAIVEHSIFCGKDSGLTIYVHPVNSAPLLPANVELTPDEKKVLQCTKSYKSSYAGIKDYRFSQSGMDRANWDAAKLSCQNKGLLDKRGAVTIEGRNAIGNR